MMEELPEGLRDGFTRVSHEILEGLMYINLTKREYKICLCILRYGYGFKQERSEIRCHQRVISKLTGLNEVVIKKAITSLEDKNIINRDKLNKTLSFNRHIYTWKLNKTLSIDKIKLNKTLSQNLIKREVRTKQNVKLGAPRSLPTKEQRAPKYRCKEIKDIVDFLNSTTGRSFKHQSDKTKKCINARLSEGFSVDDFRLVIEDKTREWKNDTKMRRFLRPETLFGTKMEGYLQEAIDRQKESEVVIA